MATTLDPLSNCVRHEPVWIAQILIGVVLVGLMTTLYLGSAVDPIDHPHGPPVRSATRFRAHATLMGRKPDI